MDHGKLNQPDSYAKNSSKLHKKVGQLLKEGFFGNYNSYQECPLQFINPKTKYRYRVDWIVPDLCLVIECQGKQHYSITSWEGKVTFEDIENFRLQQIRDDRKREECINAGYVYLEIPYSDEKIINEDYLLEKYNTAKAAQPVVTTIEKPVDKAKEFRHKMYLKSKELNKKWRKEHPFKALKLKK